MRTHLYDYLQVENSVHVNVHAYTHTCLCMHSYSFLADIYTYVQVRACFHSFIHTCALDTRMFFLSIYILIYMCIYCIYDKGRMPLCIGLTQAASLDWDNKDKDYMEMTRLMMESLHHHTYVYMYCTTTILLVLTYEIHRPSCWIPIINSRACYLFAGGETWPPNKNWSIFRHAWCCSRSVSSQDTQHSQGLGQIDS